MGTGSGHCKVMFKPKAIFQPNSENSGPMQFGYLQARSCCKENRLQGPKGSIRALNLVTFALIPAGDDSVLDQDSNGRGDEKWLNSGHIWNVKSKRMS